MADVPDRLAHIPSGTRLTRLGSRRLQWMLLTLLAVAVAGCAALPGTGSTTTVILDGSVNGFESFSGMKMPPDATEVNVTVSADSAGGPIYLVGFDLPTDRVDQFCRDGQMSRPLRVVTIPQTTRKTFHYQGDSSSGVRIGAARLPTNVRIQREVFATGTHSPTAHVQVFAYAMGR